MKIIRALPMKNHTAPYETNRSHMIPKDQQRSSFILLVLWGRLGAHLEPAGTAPPVAYESSYGEADVRLDPHFNEPVAPLFCPPEQHSAWRTGTDSIAAVQ